jgi:hypothetical protein
VDNYNSLNDKDERKLVLKGGRGVAAFAGRNAAAAIDRRADLRAGRQRETPRSNARGKNKVSDFESVFHILSP